MFGDKTVDLSQRFPVMPSGHERALRLAQDPVAAADFFEFCFQSLFHLLFGWDFDLNCSVETGGILVSYALSMACQSSWSVVCYMDIF